MDEALERVWARWCARRVLHLWDAPEVVREWLDTGEEELREEAAAETARAARAAWAAEAKAAEEAVMALEVKRLEAARSTAWAAEAARSARSARAAWAARAALETWAAWAARAASGAKAAEDSERNAQQHALSLLASLSTLLPEHGLAALRLDEALEDRWLTREVWRTLGLPDLAVVCDWAEVTR